MEKKESFFTQNMRVVLDLSSVIFKSLATMELRKLSHINHKTL
jgi:hypothetical protein